MFRASESELPSEEAGPVSRWGPGLAQGEVFAGTETSPSVTRNLMLHILCSTRYVSF